MKKSGFSKDTKTALTTGSSKDANISTPKLDGIIPSLPSCGENNSVTCGGASSFSFSQSSEMKIVPVTISVIGGIDAVVEVASDPVVGFVISNVKVYVPASLAAP